MPAVGNYLICSNLQLDCMATLPRSSIRYPPGPPRPVSEFDSGINTSTAWTGHLEDGHTPRKYLSESNVPATVSDEEDIEEITYPARVLYKFEGKAEFRELTVDAGDEVEVIKEDVGEGWSLVRDPLGKVGLLPQSYYTVCTNFLKYDSKS
jgi:sorting nexin-9/18/33